MEGGIASFDDMIISHTEKALKKTNGKIHGKNGAAVLLGVNSSTSVNRMIKLGIK